jgi:hypothetical protein
LWADDAPRILTASTFCSYGVAGAAACLQRPVVWRGKRLPLLPESTWGPAATLPGLGPRWARSLAGVCVGLCTPKLKQEHVPPLVLNSHRVAVTLHTGGGCARESTSHQRSVPQPRTRQHGRVGHVEPNEPTGQTVRQRHWPAVAPCASVRLVACVRVATQASQAMSNAVPMPLLPCPTVRAR